MADERDPLAGRTAFLLRLSARAGCLSIGTVYVLIGVWAQLALLRLARPAADEERILHRLSAFPGGTPLIIAICAGTCGYMAWRIHEAVRDPYGLGRGRNGMADRVTTALGALVYGIIAVSALKVLAGRGGHGEQGQRRFVAEVLGWPGGPWLVGACGLAILAAGVYQFVYVAVGEHRVRIRMDLLAPIPRYFLEALAWAGFAARGAILWVLGGCLAKAAWSRDPSSVRDTDSAFDFLGSVHHQVFAAVAIGTIAYGVFLILNGFLFRFGRERGKPPPVPVSGRRGTARARGNPGAIGPTRGRPRRRPGTAHG